MSHNQIYTIFTVDQQIFTITVDILWSDPERWKFFIPHIGGMHMVMSFIGCVGKLKEGTGLK